MRCFSLSNSSSERTPESCSCLLFSQCPCVPPDNAFGGVERKLSFIPLSTMTSYSQYCITLSLSGITKLSLFPLYRIKLLQKEVIGEERAAIRSSRKPGKRELMQRRQKAVI